MTDAAENYVINLQLQETISFGLISVLDTYTRIAVVVPCVVRIVGIFSLLLCHWSNSC